MRVLAIDPGQTTGMALWEFPTNGSLLKKREQFEAWQEPDPLRALDRAKLELCQEGLDALVCESFQITAATIRKSRAGSLAAIELIGALRWITYRYSIHTAFVLQSPADARTFSTDAKLRALGWWMPGQDHARSATRHLVLYLVAGGHIDPRRVVESTTKEGGA